MSILVVGSLMMDCIIKAEKSPCIKETVFANDYITCFGGNGANQAFAAKRLGSQVCLAGCVGYDEIGKSIINLLINEEIDTSCIEIVSGTKTGIKIILSNDNENDRTCFFPGANLKFSFLNILTIKKKIQESNIILAQYDMDINVIKKLVKYVKEYDKKIVLSSQQIDTIDNDILSSTFLFITSLNELSRLTNQNLVSLDDCIRSCRHIITNGAKNVVLSLGKRGCLYVNSTKTEIIPAFKINHETKLGTNAAFTGAIAASLDQGSNIIEAIRYGIATAAVKSLHVGEATAMPYKKDVDSFINSFH